MQHCSSEGIDGSLRIGHIPWVAPEAYAVWVFPPAKKSWCTAFRERASQQLPPYYREFLLTMNGCEVHGLSLYGLPPSLQGAKGGLDRTKVQPLDLVTANVYWRGGYRGCEQLFHFGARDFTDDENVGYFGNGAGLCSVRENGDVVAQWKDLPSLLADELGAAERLAADELKLGGWHA